MAADKQPTRAELLARLQHSTKDALVLEEMQRLGFWPRGQGQPGLEQALIEREAELVRALGAAQQELAQVGDPQAALKALRQQRKAEALQRREANAQKREQQRFERALAWHAAREHAAGYLGAGASGGLQQTEPAKPLLHGLPPLRSAKELADAMGVSVAELRFLAFHREVARVHHYRRFTLPKKSGGTRSISAPLPRLKRAQYWVLDQILAKVPAHPAAHGFLPGRSIRSNAAPHCGQDVVLNLDLKDFFPSITLPRIKGVFMALGYGETIATLLALLCSENPCDKLKVDGESFYVGRKAHERLLPQGAPSSPMLTNLLCRRLDRRLQGLATQLGFAYTRYADDLSFSAQGEPARLQVGRLLRRVRFILNDEGFTPHPDKLRILRRNARQEVTGVVVNQQPGASRASRRALRAALHRAQTQGLAACHWQGEATTPSQLLGQAQYIKMLNPLQGERLVAAARRLTRPDGATWRALALKRLAFRQQAAAGQAPARPLAAAWWQPKPPPLPVLQKTAQQLKDERQARINAAREARKPSQRAAKATQAATQAPSAAPQGARAHPPILWTVAAQQAAVVALLAYSNRSATSFLLGMLFLAARQLSGRPGWIAFLVGLLGLSLLVRLLGM